MRREKSRSTEGGRGKRKVLDWVWKRGEKVNLQSHRVRKVHGGTSRAR